MVTGDASQQLLSPIPPDGLYLTYTKQNILVLILHIILSFWSVLRELNCPSQLLLLSWRPTTFYLPELPRLSKNVKKKSSKPNRQLPKQKNSLTN